jgi:hypothetical protein
MTMRLALVLAILASAPIASAQDLAPEQVALEAETPSEPAPSVAEEESEEDRVFAAQAAERQRLRPWHTLFGNLTWAASNLSTLFGYIQFNDRFGWTGSPSGAGCASGGAVFGEYCAPGSIPVPHVVAVTSLTIFYGSAFSIAAVMPDPFDVGSGNNDLATRITIHRALRWASLGILVVQIILGAISANVDFGDFGAERAMAATHLALGTVSYGVITAQGIVGSLLAY